MSLRNAYKMLTNQSIKSITKNQFKIHNILFGNANINSINISSKWNIKWMEQNSFWKSAHLKLNIHINNINISINSMDDWDDIIIIQNKRKKINLCNAFWWICFLFLDILGCRYDDDDDDDDGDEDDEGWWKMMMMMSS